jgi:hypothetical protein
MSPGEESYRDSRPFPDPEHSIAPRKPRTVGGAVYLTVLAATVGGLGLVALDRWRLGLGVIGVALLCGALGRLVVPKDNAGMLGMRPRVVDVLALVLLGGGLVVLASVIPEQPPL